MITWFQCEIISLFISSKNFNILMFADILENLTEMLLCLSIKKHIFQNCLHHLLGVWCSSQFIALGKLPDQNKLADVRF